ncbi:MAG: aldo/keto reductase [Propionicimonas sp.]
MLPPLGAARVVLGTSRLTDLHLAGPVYDEFFAAGGRWFDTARVYRGGVSEQVFGAWLRSSGVRDEVRIVGKGGHPDLDSWAPRTTGAELLADARASLQALGVDRFDEYLIHRDDEQLTVGGLLDGLRAVRASGLTARIGVSNWTAARYALALSEEDQLSLSNHFGLAVPRGPARLPGLVSSFDPATHDALLQRAIPFYAWGALASGYFEGIEASPSLYSAHPASRRRREAVRCLAVESGRTAESIVIRWLATAGRHLLPVISTTRPGRIGALMSAADDASLDTVVERLIADCYEPGATQRRLLLPEIPPSW